MRKSLKADEEIRTLDPLLGKEMSTTELHPRSKAQAKAEHQEIMQHRGPISQRAVE